MGHIGAVHVDAKRSLERRQRELTRAKGAHERM